MSHARAEGLHVATLSKQCVMQARNGFMGCLGIISFSPANTLSSMTGSHFSPSLLEILAPEGSPLGPSPHLQSPRSVQWMPLPRVVRSHSMPPPICLLYFPVFLGVANALSPCCLGREGRPRSQGRLTIARWIAPSQQPTSFLCGACHKSWCPWVGAS